MTEKTKSLETDAVDIKRAVPEDAEAIMNLKRQAWLKAYVNEDHNISTEDIEKKFPEDSLPNAIKNWQEGIASEQDTDEKATFVARIDGKVVGYTSPCTEDGQRRLGALYVTPDVQGTGIGSKLLESALKWHGSDEDIFVHVVSYNTAVGFYEQHGFQETGKEFPRALDEQQGIKLLPEVEMVLRAK